MQGEDKRFFIKTELLRNQNRNKMKRRAKNLKSILCGFSASCLMLAGSVSAQEMLDGSFAGSFPPKDWNRENATGSKVWSAAWGGGADGGNYATLSAQNAGTMNDAWIVTPQVCPSAESRKLVFFTKKAAADTSGMALSVYVSATGNSMADFTEPALLSLLNTKEQQDFSLAWTADTLDLSAYQGQNIFVAFRAQNNSVAISLDEISGLPLSSFDNDFRVNSLAMTPDNILFAGDEAVTLWSLVENRVNKEASVAVDFTVNGTSVGMSTVTFDSAYVDTAKVSYAFPAAGTYTVKVAVPEDENNINNEQEMEVKVYPANFLMEDFNANKTFPPQEWQAIKEKGGTGTISHSAYSTDGPTSSKGYVSFGNDYNATLETGSARWLITPQIKPDADNHDLEFYVRMGTTYSKDPNSSLSVMLSTISNNLEDFTVELAKYERNSEKVDLPENTWMHESVDLSAYEGKDVFVAFKVEDYATCTWNVDEVGGVFQSAFAEDARVRMLGLIEPNRYWFAGEEIEILALVDNWGTQTMQDIEVGFAVNGETESSQTVSLDSKEVSDTLKFYFTPEEAGFYQFAVSVPEDDNNINNSMSLDPVQVYPEGYFIEGFEGITSQTFPPKYWDVEITSYGSKGWGVVSNAGSAYKGNNYAYSQPGYRLMTPLLQIGESDSICFYANTTWAAITWSVLISSDGRTWDTVATDSLYKASATGVYELQKLYFAGKEENFYGNRYLAILSSAAMNIDEVFGPMLASRDDQFTLVSLATAPEMVNVAGQESRFQAIVYNDGTQSQSKEVSLYCGDELLVSAQTAMLEPGQYDTVILSCVIEEPMSNGVFRAVLPQDASVYDNEAELTTHIYAPEYWRMEEGFEDVSHPYWTFSDNGWAGKPSYNAVEPAEGENYLNRSFNRADPSLAVSPYMDLRFDEYEVSIAVSRNATNPERPDKIELGFGAMPVWENVVFVDSINRMASAYPEGVQGWNTYTFTVDLSDLQAGFFMIRAIGAVNEYNSPSYENLPIDNLVIRPILDNDAELAALSSPSTEVWGADSIKTVLKTSLLNYGEEPMTAATLRYGYGDKEAGVYEWNGNLSSGADTTLLLTSDFILPNTDSLLVYVEVEVAGDENVLNNRVEQVLTVKQAYELPFVANFEDSTWNKDWQNFTLSSDGLLWRLDSTASGMITAPFGESCVYSASMDDELGAVNPDNWFVTPGLAITHPKAWLSFYVQAADPEYFAESYQVLVSTRSDRDTAFFTPVYADTLESDKLQHVVLPLDGYKGEVLNIAFRHFNCTDNFRLLLDSVHVYYPELFDVAVTVNPTEAGMVEGIGEYILDEEVVLTAVGNEGWKFSGWYQGEDLVSTENPYRFECEGDAQYEARFEEASYIVTLSAGEGGSVNPSGEQSVKHGADLAVNITANEGWQIADVLVDGVSVGAVATYTFEAVTANHTLEARFEEITYTISLSAGEGGTVSPSGEQRVKAGEDLAVTITANEGYVIEDVLVDGTSVGAEATYTFEAVTADHSLEATFKPDVANESEDKAGLHVYPNPYAEELHIESAAPMESIRILDLQGRETVRYELNGQQAVSLRPVLPEGLYLLVVEQADGKTVVRRIVKSEK